MPVLAAVDDFLFRSKIREVAKHVGVEVQFARTAEEILTQARALKPSLVIVDLNSAKADPVATIQALKADPGTAAVRTIGFASHVHVDLINAARPPARIKVLPRSAFAANLADILIRLITVRIALDEISAAAERITGAVERTPLRLSNGCRGRTQTSTASSRSCSRRPHTRFAVRSTPRCARRKKDPRARRSVTASAGNHGRGLAYAANMFELPLVVFIAVGCAAREDRRDWTARRRSEDVRHLRRGGARRRRRSRWRAAGRHFSVFPSRRHRRRPHHRHRAGRAAPSLDLVIVPIGGGGAHQRHRQRDQRAVPFDAYRRGRGCRFVPVHEEPRGRAAGHDRCPAVARRRTDGEPRSRHGHARHRPRRRRRDRRRR